MGFYLRKSLSVGPIRFNLSKSGIGVSAGIKGLRIGTGPRGNYIHAGRGGLYYRAALPGGKRQQFFKHFEETQVKKDELEEIESRDVLKMTDSSSADILNEFNTKLQKISLGPITLGISIVTVIVTLIAMPNQMWIPLTILFIGVILAIYTFYHDEVAKSIVLFYELDDDLDKAYQGLHNAFDKLAGCEKVFHVEARGETEDWKRNAGASYLVRRQIVCLKNDSPRHVKTNISVPAIPVGKQTLYFFPDRVLIFESNKVGAVSYSDINLDILSQRYIESESVPSDSQQVDQTWQYVNKKGGPDKRFNNNRLLPILLYESIHFKSKTGLNELLYLSRLNVTGGFKESIKIMAEKIGSDKNAKNKERILKEKCTFNKLGTFPKGGTL